MKTIHPVRDDFICQRFSIAGEIKSLHNATDGLGCTLCAIAECVSFELLETAVHLTEELEPQYPLIATAVRGLVQAARFDAVGSARDAQEQRETTMKWARHMSIIA